MSDSLSQSPDQIKVKPFLFLKNQPQRRDDVTGRHMCFCFRRRILIPDAALWSAHY